MIAQPMAKAEIDSTISTQTWSLIMKQTVRCGAFARSTGKPCKARACSNGRCKLHGGFSTGPKTKAGRLSVGKATSHRMASGQQAKAIAGFYAWLDRGGRSALSKLTRARHMRNRGKI